MAVRIHVYNRPPKEQTVNKSAPDTSEIVAQAVSGLGFSYGAKPALADVSFNIAAGPFKVLLGPSPGPITQMSITATSGKAAEMMKPWGYALLVGMLLTAAAPDAATAGSGQIYVTNEKSSTISVLDIATSKVTRSFKTCRRPRGIHFSKDRKQFYVGCADDNVIVVYETATGKLIKRIRGIEEPETFDLSPDGKTLYVSNEEDATATFVDVASGKVFAEVETGEEPEGVQVTADGSTVYVASEAANLVHVIDTETAKVTADIVVGTRPRRFALTPDEKELWVSAELAGQVDIIDTRTNRTTGDIVFKPTGFRRNEVTPVDVLMTADGKTAFVALGRANRVAVVDVASRQVTDYILVGKRPWGLALSRDDKTLYVANGLSDDISIIDVASRKALKSVPVGMVPYGILIDD
ncbi:MAG: PQQ-dependent catabolism-associated beta-propeller protein [Rhodospirillales bacterium]